MDNLGPANFGVILLLYRGGPLSQVTLYCHDHVGTTQLSFIERSNVLCPLLRGPLREVHCSCKYCITVIMLAVTMVIGLGNNHQIYMLYHMMN